MNNCKQYTHTSYYLRNHSNNSYKLLPDKSLQTILALQTIIRESFLKNTYKLLSDKSSFVTNYYQRNCKQYLKSTRKSFQTIYIRTYCYQRNHSKKILRSTTREIIANSTYKLLSENHSNKFLQTVTTEIIPNNSYNLLPQKSSQPMVTKVY